MPGSLVDRFILEAWRWASAITNATVGLYGNGLCPVADTAVGLDSDGLITANASG